MTSERMRRRLEALLDEADAAVNASTTGRPSPIEPARRSPSRRGTLMH